MRYGVRAEPHCSPVQGRSGPLVGMVYEKVNRPCGGPYRHSQTPLVRGDEEGKTLAIEALATKGTMKNQLVT